MSSMRAVFASKPQEALRGAWLPIRLTAVFLLLNGGQVWYLLAITITLAGLGLVFYPLLRIPALWIAVTLVFAAWILRLWPFPDNHQYLAGYWTLSIAIALCLPHPSKSLALSASWLLALVFLWASLWKGVLSSDYRDGRFFSVRLMTDGRFELQASLFSGLSIDEIEQNRVYLSTTLEESPADGPPPELRSTERFRFWVRVITWSVLGMELALALVFLLPLGTWSPPLRHGGLIAFCLGTFAFAPVAGFGWLLVILGLSQVPPESVRLRTLYLIVWCLIAFVSYAPWWLLSRVFA